MGEIMKKLKFIASILLIATCFSGAIYGKEARGENDWFSWMCRTGKNAAHFLSAGIVSGAVALAARNLVYAKNKVVSVGMPLVGGMSLCYFNRVGIKSVCDSALNAVGRILPKCSVAERLAAGMVAVSALYLIKGTLPYGIMAIKQKNNGSTISDQVEKLSEHEELFNCLQTGFQQIKNKLEMVQKVQLKEKEKDKSDLKNNSQLNLNKKIISNQEDQNKSDFLKKIQTIVNASGAERLPFAPSMMLLKNSYFSTLPDDPKSTLRYIGGNEFVSICETVNKSKSEELSQKKRLHIIKRCQRALEILEQFNTYLEDYKKQLNSCLDMFGNGAKKNQGFVVEVKDPWKTESESNNNEFTGERNNEKKEQLKINDNLNNFNFDDFDLLNFVGGNKGQGNGNEWNNNIFSKKTTPKNDIIPKSDIKIENITNSNNNVNTNPICLK